MRHEETLARAAAEGAADFDFSGEWTNERQSTMDIVQEAGFVTGVFTSRVGDEDRTMTGQLSGYGRGDLISFVVKWDSMAITAWVGRRRVEAGEDVVATLWQMTTMNDGPAEDAWHAIFAGSDRFTRAAGTRDAAKPEEIEAAVTAPAPT